MGDLEVHIPDGYLDPGVALLFYVLSAVFLGLSLWRARRILEDRHIPLLATLSAAIFAAQMLNWPIPGGTSAHLVGGALAAIYLGPLGGALVMAIVLIVQCIFFGDGGITALGANIWNMGVVDCLVGYYLYLLATRMLKDTPRAKIIGAFLGGWLGITLGAFFCGVEIGVSKTFLYSYYITIPVMTTWHAALGLIEGLITALVVAYTLRVRPGILELPKVR